MMLVRTYLAPSAIEGLGVFTAEPIKKGQAAWKFDPRFDQLMPRSVLLDAAPAVREFLERYTYDFIDDPDFIALDADEGRYMNHDASPNLDMANPRLAIATRDIEAGEELTCDYGQITIGDVTFQPARHQVADLPVRRVANGSY